MRSFRIGAVLVLTILVGIVAVAAYDFGLSAGTAEAAVAAGATVVYAPATISPLGIIFGGFLLLLFIAFLAKLIVGPRRGPMGPGGWRHGRYGAWDHENVPEQFRPMLERWHREAHTPDGGRTSGVGSAAAQDPTPPPSVA